MAEEDLTELESIVLRYNRVAMDYLKLENYKETLVLLKKADNILTTEDKITMPNRLKLVSITYNNLGCYYKKNKKPLVALNFLQRALELEIESDADNTNIAGSHLNICAILSFLSRHEEALSHAKKATGLLEIAKKTRPDSVRLISSLVVAYYNTAVEYEYLGKLNEGYNCYKNALEIAVNELDREHPLVSSLDSAMKKLKNKLFSAKADKINSRESSPLKNFLEFKHVKFPSITPTIPKKYSRSTMTPGRLFPGRASPYDNIKNISFKGSL